MSELFVLNHENAEEVVEVFQSINSELSVTPVSFAQESSSPSHTQPAGIVVCFPADEFDTTSPQLCAQIEQFLKINNFNSTLPIIPVIYQADPEFKNLGKLSSEHQSLNLLNIPLVWYKNETAEEFKAKIAKANFQSGYHVNTVSIDIQLSRKNVDIARAAIIAGSVILAIALGILTGALVGGLVFGGPLAVFLGVTLGVIVGGVTGGLAGSLMMSASDSSAAALKDEQERATELKQTEERDRRDTNINTLKAILFPAKPDASQSSAQTEEVQHHSAPFARLTTSSKLGTRSMERANQEPVDSDESQRSCRTR
ncbi:hypothetical protein [Legionella worsleiensis]|uniref:Uncharacterized protein n=1 Tax=Legionella worsleiensis TaxID=45076 RepID=A0A0W1AK32_9GAMM|nr:hypothetical protein [Legionella worsleiensis]KTD81684.1 hypothetical protein Lwor_0466 [Legionella worsleiensis]STY31906.1 Uncharacterised protein [Legionella worsleiensis]